MEDNKNLKYFTNNKGAGGRLYVSWMIMKQQESRVV